VKRIDSRANAEFKALRRLIESSRERKKAGCSMLDGVNLVTAYRRHAGLPERIVVSRSGLDNPEIRALLDAMPAVETVVLGDGLFRELSSVTSPTGILAVVKTPSVTGPLPRGGACVMLEGLQDPGNLGSILRSCAASGVEHVLLSTDTVHAWSPRALRAGMGAHFALRIHEGVNLVAAARDFEGVRVATRPGAPRSLFDLDLTGDIAFLFGNEGGGLSRDLLATADRVVGIPMPGAAESINVAAAAAVCVFERVRQTGAKSRA
jgi:TrmH family RNA methyltransferase